MVLTICLLIGLQPTVNFGNQRNLRISRLFASRLLTNLLRAQCMISKSNVKMCSIQCCVRRFFFKQCSSCTALLMPISEQMIVDHI